MPARHSSAPARSSSAGERRVSATSFGTAPVPPPPTGSLPRRVEKPWGHEIIWAHTDKYVGKLLVINTGRRLSFQYHEAKDEWIHVLSGRLLLTLEDDAGEVVDAELGPGDGAHVAVNRRHRYKAIETCSVIEVSTPELDDVVRLQDDFGREGTSAP
jgi:mannose-6-phosphate isomerase